jgi:hypothetical protein
MDHFIIIIIRYRENKVYLKDFIKDVLGYKIKELLIDLSNDLHSIS